jgi:hypothetical protein
MSTRVFSVNTRCSNESPIKNLSKANDPSLKQLGQLQNTCGSFASRQIMIYTDIPKDEETARRNGAKMANTLKQFSEYGVSPIVMAEPVTDWGVIDIEAFKNGQFDNSLATYFSTIAQSNVADDQMGVWVPFPEANLPYWNRTNVKPNDFAPVANRYLGIYKRAFPAAKGSVLLNSATYESPDFQWNEEKYISLAKYAEHLDKTLVDSFGLQGFPWSPPTTSGGGQLHAYNFLNYKIAQEAADIIGTKNIWFNTGTFSQKYTLDPINTVRVTPLQRMDILNDILGQAKKLKEGGYNVSINIYSPDRSDDIEATDWSYLSKDNDGSVKHESILIDFVSKLNQNKIGVSFYNDPV